MSKITMAAAAAAGYVLGARAGQERYQQLAEKAETLWNKPAVQKGTRRAQDKIKEVTSDEDSAADPQSPFAQEGDQPRPGQSHV